MTFKYANLTREFVETLAISEVFLGKRLADFLSRKLKRKISRFKAATLLDGIEDVMPVENDKRGRRRWKRML